MDRQLVDSHIIPKFQFKQLKKGDGHYHVLSPDPETKDRKTQKEITENLLCLECDTVRIKHYEEHLARVLGEGKGAHLMQFEQKGRFAHFQGYDYLRVKNGLLSILWRMSISQHELFSEVSLGPRHEEILRRILFYQERVPEEQYAVSLAVPTIKGQHHPDFVLTPDWTRTGNNRVYRCVIAGLLFTFDVGSAQPADALRPFILRETGWVIFKAEVEEIPFLKEHMIRLGTAQAIREGRIR
jgi:hypothetical protein